MLNLDKRKILEELLNAPERACHKCGCICRSPSNNPQHWLCYGCRREGYPEQFKVKDVLDWRKFGF